ADDAPCAPVLVSSATASSFVSSFTCNGTNVYAALTRAACHPGRFRRSTCRRRTFPTLPTRATCPATRGHPPPPQQAARPSTAAARLPPRPCAAPRVARLAPPRCDLTAPCSPLQA